MSRREAKVAHKLGTCARLLVETPRSAFIAVFRFAHSSFPVWQAGARLRILLGETCRPSWRTICKFLRGSADMQCARSTAMRQGKTAGSGPVSSFLGLCGMPPETNSLPQRIDRIGPYGFQRLQALCASETREWAKSQKLDMAHFEMWFFERDGPFWPVCSRKHR